MSYICLIANENGAAVAGDTRTSRNFAGKKAFKIISNKKRKVFSSQSEKVVWALAGITKLYGWDFFKYINRFMKKDSVPFEKRLDRYVSIMKKATKLYNIRFRETGSSTILFASYIDRKNPIVGSVTVQNGKVTSDKRYTLPIFAETGSNYQKLTDRKKYVPDKNDSVTDMKKNAARRVSEAVRTDRKLFEIDSNYRPAVGGSVLVKAIKADYNDVD